MLKKINPIVIILFVAIVIRLPQLLNPTIALDGDEAISGLMVKHILAGKDIPIYFYGQNYGFTLFESIFSLPFGAIWGVNTLTVKIPIFIMWLVGLVFFYKALFVINTKKSYLPLLLCLLLATTPAWAVWSMKARGGYATAFMLHSILLYLIFHPKLSKRLFTYIITGIFLVVIYESQKLWLAGFLPLLFYKLLTSKNVKHIGIMITASALTYSAFLLHTPVPNGYTPFLVDNIDGIISNISRVPDYLYYSLYGKYYLGILYPDNLFITLSAFAYITIIVVLTLAAIFYVFKSQKTHLFFITTVIATWGVIGSTTIALTLEPRFLLPLSGIIILSLQAFTNTIKKVKIITISSVVMCIIGIISTFTFWNFQSGRMSRTAINEIIAYLDKREINTVYTTFLILDYQLVFYSDERIMARGQWLPGRYPQYFARVAKNADKGVPVAIVGYPGDYIGMQLPDIYQTNEYFISLNPPREEIDKVFPYYIME